MSTRLMTGMLVSAALVAISAGPATAQPSSNLEDYVIFAERQIKTKGLTVPCGSIGVNQTGGLLRATNALTVAGDCVADSARLVVPFTCNQLYANFTYSNPPVVGTTFTPPVIADLEMACGFPDPFPVCNLAAPVTVTAGATTSLAPGAYGNVTVKGYFDTLNQVPVPGVLELQGGTYTFCNLKLGRYAEVRVQAPVTVNVFGVLKMANSNYLGPDTGAPVVASDIELFVNGPRAHYSRNSNVEARLCAPNAKCRITQAGVHFGAAWCDTVKTEVVNFSCASPSGAFVD
jgi:hypothetical protein